MMSRVHVERVAVLALDGVYPFELGIPSRVFGAAERRYEVSTCSVDGEPVRSSSDFMILVEHGPEILESADTVVIPSLLPSAIPEHLPEKVMAAIARIRADARIVSICTGAFILAAAGLLDGRRATTHWQLVDLFAHRYPQIDVHPDVLYMLDGRILTSAGAAAGIDACLYLIREDHGRDVANAAARRCVVPPFRDGGQRQYIERPVPKAPDSSTEPARIWAIEHLGDALTLAVLAARASMSVRTFTRRFADEVGMSPTQWIVQQRVARAQRLLETTDNSVEQIALQVGFATGASLRQHLRTHIGVTPGAYRRSFSASAG